MIGKLRGIVDTVADDWLIIDVGGVGYQVYCSGRTLAALPGRGEPVELAIETYVREDSIRLFGFASELEREWFRLLDNVQGVGTRVAMAILSTLSASDLANAVALGDKAMIARAPGVGPKLAQRVVTELKDRAPVLQQIDPAIAAIGAAIDGGGTAPAEAVSALVNLGYGQAQAAAAVGVAVKRAGDGAGTEALIRAALKELAR